MQSFEVGKTYCFLAIPLWMKGKVVREDIRFVFLDPDTLEYLPDATSMGDYAHGKLKGEKLNFPGGIHKDTISVFLGPFP